MIAGHIGHRASLKALSQLKPLDVRAFMAARRGDDISSRSLMRALAGVRSFARFLERNGKGKGGALAAVRAPKLPKTPPKPLTAVMAQRLTEPDPPAREERGPWTPGADAPGLAR